MKITYFHDTDTLHIEFRSSEVAETRELDENTLLDIDAHGNLCGLTYRANPPAATLSALLQAHCAANRHHAHSAPGSGRCPESTSDTAARNAASTHDRFPS
jgi:uncharacterized protein YuzE